MAFRPTQGVSPNIEMLMRAALAEQEQANTGERGGPDIRPTVSQWERPDMADVPFARERGLKMMPSVVQQIFQYLRENPVSFQSGGDRSRGFSFTPRGVPSQPGFNERQEAAAKARNTERGAQFASGLKDRDRQIENRIADERMNERYRSQREIGAEFRNPRLTPDELQENAAARARGTASAKGPPKAKPVKVGGNLPTIQTVASSLSYRAANERRLGGGVSAKADSLDALSRDVRDLHADLRQATSPQEIDEIDDRDLGARLSADEWNQVKKAVSARRKQVSGG